MLRSTVRHLEDENARLREIIARLTHKEFGSGSERACKLDLEEEEPPATDTPAPEAAEGAEEKPSAPRKRTRRLWADITSVVEHELVPDEVKADPDAYKRLDEKEVQTSQRLEFVPAHTVLHVYLRPAYVRRDGRGAPLRAAAPVGILPGSNMGASVLATLAHGKYCLHLPLYRQLRELERMGLHGLTEPLACHWIRAVADALLPLYRAMHAELLESPALHVDETPVRRLKGANKNGYMWVVSSADTAGSLYLWSESRAAGALDTLLREGMDPSGRAYGGAIVTDGYEAYASWLAGLKPDEPRPQWQMCWAHVRRKFVECSRSSCDPQWSAQVVEDIKPLYAIERKLREGKAPPGEILQTRKETAAKIVENLFQKLQDKLADTANPPLNKLRDAIDYALKRRDTLKSWLDNPCLPIDNNTVERAVRPVTVGRKNYLFIGAPEAGQRAAVLYTMLGECKRCGVDPLAWLTHVLQILPAYRGDYADLLPGSLTLPQAAPARECRL